MQQLEPAWLGVPSARVPPIVRLRDIGCGWPLGVTILAVVKTVFRTGWNTERRTKALGLYIGAAAKRAWIKFRVNARPRLLTSISHRPPQSHPRKNLCNYFVAKITTAVLPGRM
jgi:hypothetical protein